jgi:hypothetical protein
VKEVLRHITGHTTLLLLDKNIKITDRVAENELMNAWNKLKEMMILLAGFSDRSEYKILFLQ